MKTPAELAADPRTMEAERRLKQAGMTDAWWSGLLARVAGLPLRHEVVCRETQTEATRRRIRLANKMRALGADIAEDPEAGRYYPGYNAEKPCLNTFATSEYALSLSAWLEACAESLEAESIVKPLEDRRRTELRPFVMRGVSHWIEHYLAIGRELGIVTSTRARNAEAAMLASALLSENITANEVTQARRAERRSYHKQ